MSVLSDLLFRESRNPLYEEMARFYYNYWTSIENVKKILTSPIALCNLCTSAKREAISVLGIYFDSLPFTSVTILDAATVTIMSLLEKDQLSVESKDFQNLVETINPDVIRNHYFMNLCDQKEKRIHDWDAIQILKSLMLHLKASTVNLRQYANLTKFLKNECQGSCNTFINQSKLEGIEKRQTNDKPKFFVSDKFRDYERWTQDKDNTPNRFLIAFHILQEKN